jgi:hypothetical protein
MTFKFFKGGDTGVTLHVVKSAATKEPLVTGRRVEVVSRVDGFCARFSAHFKDSQLSQAEFAAQLSKELDTPVSQVNVNHWMKSAGPRERKEIPQFQQKVLSTAEKIALKAQLARPGSVETTQRKAKLGAPTPASNAAATVSPEEVASQIREWLGQELNPFYIQQTAGIDEATYQQWAAGKSAVSAARWALLQKELHSLVKLIASRNSEPSKRRSATKPAKKD